MGAKRGWRDRQVGFWRRHPRANALFILLVAATLVALDVARVRSAVRDVLGGDWHPAVLAGLGWGVGVLVVAAWVARIQRSLVVERINALGVVAVGLVLVPFVLTHPRHGDGITSWGMVEAVVAVDTVLVGLLGYVALRRWRAPPTDEG